ncbi:MAG: non-homologous end-joining DNA ligase [Anaeromyxobacteraceae bacterium]
MTREVKLTNLAKPLWPAPLFTKGDLIAYYRAVAPALLPHLAGRALTLARYPDGVDGPGWFQSNCPPGKPDWLPIAELPARTTRRGVGPPVHPTIRYCLCDDLPSLLWIANTGAIELHPFLALARAPERPTALVVDLDPAPPAGLLAAGRAALVARDALAAAGLAAFPKTSGMYGLHLFAPLDADATFEASKGLARALARDLAAAYPALFTDRPRRAERAGRVYLDWRQNAPGLSTVSPYSLRAGPVPLASTPLAWNEIERAVARGEATALRFGPADVLARVSAHGDLFADVLPRTP